MRTFRKEVKASKSIAIKEVAKHNGVSEIALSMLYNCKDKVVTVEDFDGGLKEQIFKKHLEWRLLDFVSNPLDYWNDTLIPNEAGQKLIEQVDARFQTRHGVKYGYDLFPFDAAIPELRCTV